MLSPRRGRYLVNENHRVMIKGTNIQPKSRTTAGAIITRAADRDALVAIGYTSIVSGRAAGVHKIEKRKRRESVQRAGAWPALRRKSLSGSQRLPLLRS